MAKRWGEKIPKVMYSLGGEVARAGGAATVAAEDEAISFAGESCVSWVVGYREPKICRQPLDLGLGRSSREVGGGGGNCTTDSWRWRVTLLPSPPMPYSKDPSLSSFGAPKNFPTPPGGPPAPNPVSHFQNSTRGGDSDAG